MPITKKEYWQGRSGYLSGKARIIGKINFSIYSYTERLVFGYFDVVRDYFDVHLFSRVSACICVDDGPIIDAYWCNLLFIGKDL